MGKKYKYSANIENFIKNGKIKIRKSDFFENNQISEEKNKDEYKYSVLIQIDEKEMTFKDFNEIINKIKLKNIYKYGKY